MSGVISIATIHGRGAVIVQRLDRPTQLILLAAFVSMIFSIYLWFFTDKNAGIFVGLWVPSILAFGALMRLPR